MVKKLFISILFILIILPGFNVHSQEEEGGLLMANPDMEMIINADLQFIFCKDYQCSEEKTEFFVDDPVFISYKSDIKLPVVANIKGTDIDFQDRLFLPNYYVFKEKGDYEINFEIQMEDLKNIAKKRKILVKSRCLIDGKCSDEGSLENCSQDCEKVELKIFSPKNIIIFLFLIIGFIMIVYGIIKKRSNT